MNAAIVPTDKPQISTYVRPGYKKRLKILAEREGRSVSNYCARVLEEHIRQCIEEGHVPPLSDHELEDE